tara:strand:+ start:7862 stop:8413 length:552 start_codon:yes stop_codon:yes gene_type:complete
MVLIYHITNNTNDDFGNDVTQNNDVSSLNDIIMQNNYNIYLVVYDPECGACKGLSPEWKKMEKHVHEQKLKNVAIAKVHNQFLDKLKPEIETEFVPHIVKLKKKKVYPYSDSRQSDDLIKWVNEHGDDDDDIISYVFGGKKKKTRKPKKKSRIKSRMKSRMKSRKSLKHRKTRKNRKSYKSKR